MPERFRVRVTGWMMVGLLLPPWAAAQSQPPLAEVARREAERRKAIQAAARVLTNKDLPKVVPVTPVPAADAAEAPPEDSKPEAEQRAAAVGARSAEPPRDEAWWRRRVGGARDALQRNDVLAAALQSRINALAADFVARDDPYQRAKIAEDREKALAEMARVLEDSVALRAAIADIEEEARKAGVAPGWLR